MLPPVEAYLNAVDAATPGLVTGFHLTGSVALGDYRPHCSDIDFIAVVAHQPDAGELAALAHVHAGLGPKPHLDGVYLTAAEFAAQPADGREAPYSLDGEFHATGECFQLNPVLWAELAQDGVTVRGTAPSITIDRVRLHDWNLANLRDYWQPFVAQCRAIMAERDESMPLPYPDSLPWLVTGPPRLHLTLATGEIASKTKAARYAAALFPNWAELIDKALAIRDGRDVKPIVADMIDAADFAETVINDALATPTRADDDTFVA
jgi:aminoglycoside adenylyltransferase-like protein/nucleotidyltransferase-like protein